MKKNSIARLNEDRHILIPARVDILKLILKAKVLKTYLAIDGLIFTIILQVCIKITARLKKAS